MLARLSDHVIVCGYGRVGRRVATELKAEGIPFVIIDPDPEKIPQIRDAGHQALAGDAADEARLKEAGINRARGLVVAASSDAENVFIVLTARSLRPDLLIVARSNYEESEAKLLKAGANRVILPYGITGHRMVTMLVRPDVADFLDEVAHAGGLELFIEQIHLSPTSTLSGQTLSQARLDRHITVLACKSPDGHLNTRPNGDTVLEADAQIIALGTRDILQGFIELAQGKETHSG